MAAQNENILDILIYGDITSWEWVESDISSYTLAKLISESQAERINVNINSYGGEAAEGLAIYNALKNHPARVVTRCDGFACSAASVVFMAGEERIMNEASLLMIHNAGGYVRGNAAELRKAADDLDKISKAAANTYRAVMTISEETLDAMLEGEEWILPEEAISYGFATKIRKVGEPGKPMYSARGTVFAKLVSEKRKGGEENPLVPENGEAAPQAEGGFQKLFHTFKERED